MNKAELVYAITQKTEMSKKDVDLVVTATFEVIKEALKEGEKISLVGFGTFAVKERAARTGKNPATGEEIEIAACKVPTFAAGKTLKDAIQ